jgi:hypothetical protein
MRSAPVLARLVLATLCLSMSARAEGPPTRKLLSYDVEKCNAAAQALTQGAPSEEKLESMVRSCLGFYGEEACRAAWEGSFAIKGHHGRLSPIVQACTRAYCDSLSPRPKLCDSTPRFMTSTEVLAQWPEFQRALFVHDHGPRAEAFEPAFTGLLTVWTRTNLKPTPARQTLRLVKTDTGAELEHRDAKGRRQRRWAFQALPSEEQLRQVGAATQRLAKPDDGKTACVRIEADPLIEYALVEPILRAASRDGACQPLDFYVLIRMPAATSAPPLPPRQ